MTWILRLINKYYPPTIPVLNFSYLLWSIDKNNIYFQSGLLISVACLIFLYIQRQTRVERIKKSSKDNSEYYIRIVKDKGLTIITIISILLWLISFYIIIQYGFWNGYLYVLGMLNFVYIIIIPSRMYAEKETFSKIRARVNKRILPYFKKNKSK